MTKFDEYFYSSKHDKEIVIVKNDEKFSLGLLKKYIFSKSEIFKSSPVKNVVIMEENGFDFVVNFFAAVFAQKEIYLVSSNERLKELDIEYICAQNDNKTSDCVNFSQINPDDIFIKFFTSGSCAQPKVITKTLWNLIRESEDLFDEFSDKIPSGCQVVTTSTPAHLFCLSFYIMFAFFNGFVINSERISFPEQLRENTILISTPAFLDRICANDTKPTLVLSAGSKLKTETFKKFPHLIEIYGSTESGVIAFKTKPEDINLKLFKNVSVKTAEDGAFIKSDFFPEDEIFVNDKIEILPDRKIILKGRTDRIVKIQEKRISLPEIENAILNCELVEDVFCFDFSGKLCAAVVLNGMGKEFFINKGINETVKFLKSFTKKSCEIFPKRWRFLIEIPKTVSGKNDIEKIKNIFSVNLSYPFIFDKKNSPDEISLSMIFYKNSNFFNGHFENFPIVPGVVQLYYAGYFIENLFEVELAKNAVKKMKFSNVIEPDKVLTLKMQNKGKSFEYTYLANDTVFSSGIFLLNEVKKYEKI
ncbi:acyl-CoA synthetase [bacterium]|nr:acyl-CoA synthetase [bacterium]